MSTESERAKQGTMNAPQPINNKKVADLTLWLDNDIIEKFKASGDGLQTRINDALKSWIRTHA